MMIDCSPRRGRRPRSRGDRPRPLREDLAEYQPFGDRACGEVTGPFRRVDPGSRPTLPQTLRAQRSSERDAAQGVLREAQRASSPRGTQAPPQGPPGRPRLSPSPAPTELHQEARGQPGLSSFSGHLARIQCLGEGPPRHQDDRGAIRNAGWAPERPCGKAGFTRGNRESRTLASPHGRSEGQGRASRSDADRRFKTYRASPRGRRSPCRAACRRRASSCPCRPSWVRRAWACSGWRGSRGHAGRGTSRGIPRGRA